jgi:hypothetical protein
MHQVVSISLRDIPERMNPFPVPSTYSERLEESSFLGSCRPFPTYDLVFLDPTAVVRVS